MRGKTMTSQHERKRNSVAALVACGTALLFSAACSENPFAPKLPALGTSFAARSGGGVTIYATGLTSPRDLKFGPDGLLLLQRAEVRERMSAHGSACHGNPCR